MKYGRSFGVNAGLNSTLTLFRDLAVSAQQDVFHCGVKDEMHILQKALFGEEKMYLYDIFWVFQKWHMHFYILTYSYSSMHGDTQLHSRFTLNLVTHIYSQFYTQGAI